MARQKQGKQHPKTIATEKNTSGNKGKKNNGSKKSQPSNKDLRRARYHASEQHKQATLGTPYRNGEVVTY